MKNSHKHNLKRVTLELGGKSANIIFKDANFEGACAFSHYGVFNNQGQSCNSGTRVFVHEDIYDEFVKKQIELAKGIIVGDPFDGNTNQGP
jgi:aldehyde dehydrogenase (NAD+)